MPHFISQYDLLTPAQQADFHDAKSITLEAREGRGNRTGLTSLDDAHEYGFFEFHLAFDDRPERRNFLAAPNIMDAVQTLDILRRCNPSATVRLVCQEGQADIATLDVIPEACRAILHARASMGGRDCDWTKLAQAADSCAASGEPLDFDTDGYELYQRISDLLHDPVASALPAAPPTPLTSSSSIFFGARYVDRDTLKELPRVTYLTVRAAVEGDWQDPMASIEDAQDDGFFAIDLGLPDQPEMRNLAKFDNFDDVMACIDMLKHVYPAARLWLNTVEILAEITNPDVFQGAVQARATFDPSDSECDWNKLAEIVSMGGGAPYGFDHNPAAERIAHLI